MGEAAKDGKDQCLTRMCVQRSKIWSRCARRGSKRRTKCLICKAREVAGPGEVGVVAPGEVGVVVVVAAGNLVVEAGGILVVEAVETEEGVGLAAEAGGILAAAVVVVVVEVVREEEEELEGNVGKQDSHEDSIELKQNYFLSECYITPKSLLYSNFGQQFLFLFVFLQFFVFVH